MLAVGFRAQWGSRVTSIGAAVGRVRLTALRDIAARTGIGAARSSPTSDRMIWAVERAALVTLVGYVLWRVYALIATGHIAALWLKDYRLYMDATERFLAGGSFYPTSQLTGSPWALEWGAILYPPVALAWFVPWSFLPAWLWLVTPIVVTVAVVAYWRPSLRGWIGIAGLLAIEPLSLLSWTAGTPTTWFVAVVALSTRWPALTAFVLVKPTLLPFGLVGLNRRAWWAITAGLAVVSLAMWPMTSAWFDMLLTVSGPDAGLLYSLASVPFLLVPLVARVSGRRTDQTSGQDTGQDDRGSEAFRF
jgi:hypothetical protein